MKKGKRYLRKLCSLAVVAAVLASMIILPGMLSQIVASAEAGENCTARIEPDTYIANSLSVKPARNYTALYNDGMYDGGDKSLMLPMGPLMYTSGAADQVGELTYRLPYAVSELKITGIEDPAENSNNAFKGFWVSKDGYNWQGFAMSKTRTDDVVCGFTTARKGVCYYGSAADSFRYVKVALGGKSVNGINYLYIPPAGSADNCTARVDPAAEGVLVAESNTNAKVTLARHTSNNTVSYDGVQGMGYNGVPNNGGLVTFALPYAVGELKLTGVETYWPTGEARGSNRFLGFEVSADGENWRPFTMAGTDFAMARDMKATAGNNPPKVTLPVYRIGVTYYGTDDTQFRYVRIAFGRDWVPQLCNFYLPARDRGNDLTVRVDPVDVVKTVTATDAEAPQYGRDNTYKYDGTGILCFKKNVTKDGRMVFELPYEVNELKMTGVEIITAAATETDRPDLVQYRFTGFRVSADGKNWTDFFMERTTDGVLANDTQKRREGVILYGAAGTAFKYIEVTLGKNWIPGISWFYLPEPEILLSNYELSVYAHGPIHTLTATLKEGVTGNVTWATGDPAVVTVDADGTLTPVAPGHAVITATVGGYTAECEVTVREGYGPDGCTSVIDAYAYIGNTSSRAPARTGTISIPGGVTYPMVFGTGEFNEEPIFTYKLPHETNELKMTGIEDAGAVGIQHSF